VLFPYHLSSRLSREGKKQILFQFTKYKITKEEISEKAEKIVMLVRPSIQFDLDHIPGIDGGNLIYSMWNGYLQNSSTKKFIDFLLKHQFVLHHIHTSGHADIETLIKMVEALKPIYIVPIHTFSGSEYKKIFSAPILEMNDGETRKV
jgi:ribonuclease J